jgi:hypothetical protein
LRDEAAGAGITNNDIERLKSAFKPEDLEQALEKPPI